MQAALSWLRALCPFEGTVEEVAGIFTARGLTVDSIARHGDDATLEIDVPANRPDCLGHRGLARELAAATGLPLAATATAPAARATGPAAAPLQVHIDDSRRCSRYTASRVSGVRVGPSPEWVVRRLELCGLRSINNVVDASNLVLLELGNPIHFFDAARIRGNRIEIRTARAGERLTTLDGIDRELDVETLVIADGRGPIALAGVMGGADSEIGETTGEVLIEAAWFAPATIRRTARRLGLHSDASHRFERGVDPEALLAAQELAQAYLEQLAGGRPSGERVDVHPARREARRLTLRLNQIERLLGYAPTADAVREALAALGLDPREAGAAGVVVAVPSWRVDLECEADLVEEFARHAGYDRIPLPESRRQPPVDSRPAEPTEERARDLLAHAGFHEALGYAMIERGRDEAFLDAALPAPLSLSNPLAEALAVLRRSLLPGLLSSVDLNLRRGAADVRLFEVGRVFLPRAPGQFPHESSRVGLAWCGSPRPGHWAEALRPVDFFDLAGLVDHLLRGLSPGAGPRIGTLALPAFHPGRSACWTTAGGERLAWGGQLHPQLQDEGAPPILLAEIDLDLLAGDPGVPRYRALPRLTPVTRDLALVMPPQADFAGVLATLVAVAPPAPATFRAVDRYQGPPLAPGHASLTVRVTLTPAERTLTESEIEEYRRNLVEALQSNLGLDIRQ